MDIESVSSLDDLLDGIFSEAESAMTAETPPAEQPPVQASPPEQQPPVSEPVSNEAAPAVDVAADVPVDASSDPVTPPASEPLNWDSDDNPYRKQATDYQRAFEQARQNVLQKREQEEYEARQRLIADLPNMEPERAQNVVRALQAWDQEQANKRVQELSGQTEPLLKELAIRRLGDELGLTVEERTKLEQFVDPKVLDFTAREMASNRKAHDAKIAELQKQISELKLAAEAKDRMQSPVDRVAVGAGATSAIPSDVNTIDEFLDALDLPWSR